MAGRMAGGQQGLSAALLPSLPAPAHWAMVHRQHRLLFMQLFSLTLRGMTKA